MVSIKHVGFVALLAGAAAFAEGNPNQQFQPPKDAKALLENLHQANQDEIQLAQLAETKAQSSQTKEVAQQILREHQEMDQQVTQLAQQMKVTLGKPSPSGKLEKQMKTLSKDVHDTLKEAKGPTFDTLYLSHMVVEHGKDLQMLQAAQAKFQNDPQVSQLLTQSIPVISRHQQLAAQALSKFVQQSQAVGGAGIEGTRPSPSSPSGY